METKELVDILASRISEEDAYLVLKIAKAAISQMGLTPMMLDEDFSKLSVEERYAELLTPRLCSYQFTDEVSCIFVRFVGNEVPLAHVLYFPIEATSSFLETARNYYANTKFESAEMADRVVFQATVDMLCLLLRNVYSRITVTMSAITEETINEWYRIEHLSYRNYCAKEGVEVPDLELEILKTRKNILDEHKKDVGHVWEAERKRFEQFQRISLAREYEKLYPHWDAISRLYRRGMPLSEYERYAKVAGFEDTPDDLLAELKGSHHRGVSKKALEHAARRVGLVNAACKDLKVLEKRRSGIKASGYSIPSLFRFLVEGKNLLTNT